MSRMQSWWRRLGKPPARHQARHQVLWFVLLWVAGVLGTALLALPFHLLVAAAKGS